MGYPMTYQRVVNRNGLQGGYDPASNPIAGTTKAMICGDMRRLEADTMDDAHLAAYARVSGATVDQVRLVFAEFFAAHPFLHGGYR